MNFKFTLRVVESALRRTLIWDPSHFLLHTSSKGRNFFYPSGRQTFFQHSTNNYFEWIFKFSSDSLWLHWLDTCTCNQVLQGATEKPHKWMITEDYWSCRDWCFLEMQSPSIYKKSQLLGDLEIYEPLKQLNTLLSKEKWFRGLLSDDFMLKWREHCIHRLGLKTSPGSCLKTELELKLM